MSQKLLHLEKEIVPDSTCDIYANAAMTPAKLCAKSVGGGYTSVCRVSALLFPFIFIHKINLYHETYLSMNKERTALTL